MLESLALVLLSVWLFLMVSGVSHVVVLTVALPVVAAGCLIAAIALYPRGDW